MQQMPMLSHGPLTTMIREKARARTRRAKARAGDEVKAEANGRNHGTNGVSQLDHPQVGPSKVLLVQTSLPQLLVLASPRERSLLSGPRTLRAKAWSSVSSTMLSIHVLAAGVAGTTAVLSSSRMGMSVNRTTELLITEIPLVGNS